MSDKNPKRYRRDQKLYQMRRRDRISTSAANEVYDRIAELQEAVGRVLRVYRAVGPNDQDADLHDLYLAVKDLTRTPDSEG